MKERRKKRVKHQKKRANKKDCGHSVAIIAIPWQAYSVNYRVIWDATRGCTSAVVAGGIKCWRHRLFPASADVNSAFRKCGQCRGAYYVCVSPAWRGFWGGATFEGEALAVVLVFFICNVEICLTLLGAYHDWKGEKVKGAEWGKNKIKK